jgi:hypothetical protein
LDDFVMGGGHPPVAIACRAHESCSPVSVVWVRQDLDATNLDSLDESGVLAWLLYRHRSAVELYGAGDPVAAAPPPAWRVPHCGVPPGSTTPNCCTSKLLQCCRGEAVAALRGSVASDRVFRGALLSVDHPCEAVEQGA